MTSSQMASLLSSQIYLMRVDATSSASTARIRMLLYDWSGLGEVLRRRWRPEFVIYEIEEANG